VHLEVSAAPVRDGDGRVELAIATFQDVTAQRQAEQALRRAQRLEAMGQLTGGVAHDFNNLLMVASGNLQLLARRTSDEVLLRFARGAMEAVRRGADVTRRLLAFAREQPLEAVPIDLGTLLPDVAENALSRTLGGKVRVETEVDPGLWPALVDRNELHAALLNLAINARDAMPGGGILTISAANAGSEALPDGVRGGLPPATTSRCRFLTPGSGWPRMWPPARSSRSSPRRRSAAVPAWACRRSMGSPSSPGARPRSAAAWAKAPG
jgi:signal transduction histidine kinase